MLTPHPRAQLTSCSCALRDTQVAVYADPACGKQQRLISWTITTQPVGAFFARGRHAAGNGCRRGAPRAPSHAGTGRPASHDAGGKAAAAALAGRAWRAVLRQDLPGVSASRVSGLCPNADGNARHLTAAARHGAAATRVAPCCERHARRWHACTHARMHAHAEGRYVPHCTHGDAH